MQQPRFLIQTTMEKEDYRKFLYIATFCRNKFTIPLVAAMALVGSLIVNLKNNSLHLQGFLLTWIFMLVLAVGAVCFRVERQNKQRVTTDKTGTFGAESLLHFYEDKVVMETKSLNSTGELRYDQFHRLIESKEYLIFYLTANQAALIRKKDIENIAGFKAFIVPKFSNRYNCICRKKTALNL